MLALLAAIVVSAVTPQPSAAPALPSDAAAIVNTGSTNTRGYRIVVLPNKQATVTVTGYPVRNQTLSAETSSALFKALAATTPLSKLVSEPCMKSASFGSTTYVEYKGHRSPDLSCPLSGSAGTKLSEAVQRVTSEAHVFEGNNALRHTMGAPMAPGPALPQPSGAATPKPEPT